MLNKPTVLTVIICLTVLAFVLLERDRLCDFRIKTKILEVDAGLSYELNR
ncbi:Hok/Gef family protein [Pantoea sp. JKS000250]|nr:Hok/Gef family protein [Pantoea sp. JKS000250]